MTVLEIVAGILVPVGAYFAGVKRTEAQYAQNDSDARITRVLDIYIEAANAAKINGFAGLIKAGVGTLKNDREIRELIDRIVKHGHNWDPRKQLGQINTHRFFQLAIERRINWYANGAIEALIAEVGKGG